MNNSVGGNSCGETTCECQPEYQPPTCCDCKEGNFFKTPEGKCLSTLVIYNHEGEISYLNSLAVLSLQNCA